MAPGYGNNTNSNKLLSARDNNRQRQPSALSVFSNGKSCCPKCTSTCAASGANFFLAVYCFAVFAVISS